MEIGKTNLDIEESMISCDIESIKQSEISTFQNLKKEIIRQPSSKTEYSIISNNKIDKKANNQ